MTYRLHPFLEQLGPAVASSVLQDRRAAALAAYLEVGTYAEASRLGCHRLESTGVETVLVEVRVERPQDLAAPIRRTEPIALVFRGADEMPTVLAAREDFPDTPHQSASPASMPKAPCIDDRPWDEARSSWTPFACLERVRWWLGAAASGELTGDNQAVEPLFMHLRQELVVPRSALEPGAVAATLAVYLPPVDLPRVLLVRTGKPDPHLRQAQIRLVTLHLEPQIGSRIRSAPATLAELAAELAPRGYDLVTRLRDEAVVALGSREALEAKLVLLLVIPIARTAGAPVELHDVKAFLTACSMGEVGAALGCLLPAKEGPLPFVRSILPGGAAGDEVRLEALRAVLDLDRALAASGAGRTAADMRKVVLVGAGAVGSHLTLALAREGAFRWTMADDDYLLPHNLIRHALQAVFLGFPKAIALAHEVGELLNDPDSARGFVAKVDGRPMPAELEAGFAEADLVLDASASVATGRYLSAYDACPARRASVFMNPSGTAAVLLLESASRSVRLDTLEAQYYRLLLQTSELRGHLAAPPEGLRYSGSCRSVTSRIPASSVATLAGLMSRGLQRNLDADGGAICVWSMDEEGTVRVVRTAPAPSRHFDIGEWAVLLDDALISSLREQRCSALPAETGGVLVGIVDAHHRTITLVEALAAPADSTGSPSEFVRGTEGLSDRLRHVQDITRDQVRYAGEWHSHPPGHRALPSAIDLSQLAYLRGELARDGLPPVMVIVGEQEIAILAAEPGAVVDR